MEISQFSTSLFIKNGTLNTPRTFQQFGYTWRISLSFCEKHSVPAVDLKLECVGIEQGTFLSMLIDFRNEMRPGKHTFWHVFDSQRKTFCYRRIVTGVRHVRSDGVTIVSFPIDRFLRRDEIGEKYDAEQQTKWPFYAPVTWNVQDDGRVETESVKTCYNRFEYSVILKHIVTLNSLPERFHLPKWPKSNRLPVQLNFFEPVWPQVRDVILRMNEEAISSENCWNLCDILGAYYHQWQFDEKRLLELDRTARRLGFLKFMDGIGLEGNFTSMIDSMKTADVVSNSKCGQGTRAVEIVNHAAIWIIDRIPEEDEPPVMLKIFSKKTNIQMTITGFSTKFRGTEYYSIGAVLLGELKKECIYDCSVELGLESENAPLIRRTAGRCLNNIQNTMRIPIFCSKEQLESYRNQQVIKFDVRVRIAERSGNNCIAPGSDSELLEMPGQNDVTLKFEERCIAVNKTFLAHHVEFFSTMFFNENFEEHKKEVIEMSSVSYEEMIHFLDVLYHGTKVFKVSEYYHVLRMSDEWICKFTMDIVEKAVINTKCSCVNKKKLANKFKLHSLLKSLHSAETKKRDFKEFEQFDNPETKRTRVDNSFIV